MSERIDLHIHNDHVDEVFQRTVLQQFDKLQLALSAITTTLTNVLSQEAKIMSTELDLERLVTELNDNTNAMAIKQDSEIAEIARLKQQIADGTPVTQGQLDAVVAGLQPISDRLKALGADTTTPIPPDTTV